jgi:hypothetical protein
MLKALAEASGRFQQKLWPPLFGFDPQYGEAGEIFATWLWISGISRTTPQTAADSPKSSCLRKFDKPIIPGFRPPTYYFRLSLK